MKENTNETLNENVKNILDDAANVLKRLGIDVSVIPMMPESMKPNTNYTPEDMPNEFDTFTGGIMNNDTHHFVVDKESETSTTYVCEIPLAGVSKKDVRMTMTDDAYHSNIVNYVKFNIQTYNTDGSEKESYIREFCHDTKSSQVSGVKSTMKNGMLTIKVTIETVKDNVVEIEIK